jgi:hypothetical protein
MASTASDRFFDQLRRRGHEPELRRARGTVRFDLHHGRDTEHWLVAVDRGDLTVRRGLGQDPDTIIHTERELFDRIVTGRANAMASRLRGLLGISGDPELAVLVRRLFGRPA